ncbi:MAG TPA: cupin domain-containing protein, partial [Polyangiaceae bacterium]|nr:cupin domain-containing protein [Polyangiaceae bacterium]
MSDVTSEQNPELMLFSHESAVFFTPEPKLQRSILAHNPKLMLVLHRMEHDWVGARHSHPHDQAVFVISGKLRFMCGQESFEASTGDSFVVRSGVEHQAWALE